MSGQALNLRRSVQIARRHKIVFGTLVALGLLAGGAYAAIKPPTLSSTALVVLPQASVPSAQAGASGTGDSAGTDMATQVVIATSDVVLSRALPHVSPPVSLLTLQSDVQVKSVTGNVLAFSASGRTAAQAEATANAVANSYIAYVGAANSPVGRVSATVLESATTATGTKLPERVAVFALLGVLGGALVGFIVALALGHNERRLTERDAIANSIGAPVLASIPVARPSDPASWAKLLEEYEPGVVHAWGLSKMLRHFGVAEIGATNGSRAAGGSSLTVLSLSSDSKALALGPQLAAFAASQGIPTALVIGPQQDVNATATLRTACAAPPSSAGSRRKPLRLIVTDDGRLEGLRAAFVVVVTTVDAQAPSMPDTVRTAATVLGVSAGAATAEQLARAATAAAAGGRDIFGIVVADPEPGDQTTGRIPRLAPAVRRALPTRVNDVSTEIRR